LGGSGFWGRSQSPGWSDSSRRSSKSWFRSSLGSRKCRFQCREYWCAPRWSLNGLLKRVRRLKQVGRHSIGENYGLKQVIKFWEPDLYPVVGIQPELRDRTRYDHGAFGRQVSVMLRDIVACVTNVRIFRDICTEEVDVSRMRIHQVHLQLHLTFEDHLLSKRNFSRLIDQVKADRQPISFDPSVYVANADRTITVNQWHGSRKWSWAGSRNGSRIGDSSDE